MKRSIARKAITDFLLLILIMTAAVLISLALSHINNDNNPFAMAVFILAVALIARVTTGYVWGILASLIGTLCVNYVFTYPFWEFDITYPGYPLTIAVMLVVSVLISTLTTQIKQQEKMRLDMEREKMHANLLRAISHDIRTPLASILGASSALQVQELSAEDQNMLLAGIQRDARWLVRITENLLSVTRLSGDNVRIKTDDEVLEEIIGSAILKYHASPGTLPVDVDGPDKILIVSVDGVLIEQVLINLFDNVSAHAAGASRIWLHISEESTGITVSVEDDGEGIPAQMIGHIFDGTTQLTGLRHSDDRRSMGIGLSVCRTIIRVHGGDMKAGKSRHGGAAIQFTVPGKEEVYHGELAK